MLKAQQLQSQSLKSNLKHFVLINLAYKILRSVKFRAFAFERDLIRVNTKRRFS